jgi:hypothetical protein
MKRLLAVERAVAMNWMPAEIARRTFLFRSGISVGGMALGGLFGTRLTAQTALDEKVRAKAKRVIWLYMAGGMSHLDTFDYKPDLAKLDGQPMPESMTKGQQIAQLQGQALRCFAPQHPFERWGRSGQQISTIWPKLAANCADDMCIIRSLFTEAINHDPAHTFMNTGSMVAGRPAFGSWLWYGLGAETQKLPGFVVMVSTGQYGQKQPIAARQWHSGFLPSSYQGVEFRSTGDPVMYVSSPDGAGPNDQRSIVDAIGKLNALGSHNSSDPEVAARISQYEMAFRMQTSVPELMDVRDEPQHVLELYGTKGGDGSFAANCLLARRLAERGVRFIQLYHRDWDHHGSIKSHIAGSAAEVDQGAAALITDLKQRGMLDDTIVLFGSEFGRTPMAQGDGRDHHLAGFTMWAAGGGFKPGFSFGSTDDFGYHAVENRVSVHDLHATMLHLLGIDHSTFTYKFQGLDARLTGVEPANVIGDLLA